MIARVERRSGIVSAMAKAADPFHDRLLAIVKSLPETEEDWPWGSIHCKVAGKIFVGWGRDDDGIMCIGIRTTLPLQAMLVASDPRFTIAKYVGKYGGIDMRLGKNPSWAEVEQLIVDSYRIIAPKRLVKVLDARGAAKTPSAKARPKKAAAKRRS
jgi:predicted DNA-binding protein (MmcQ/YjbR family)